MKNKIDEDVMFDKEKSPAITTGLGGDGQIVASYQPGFLGNGFSLFIGRKYDVIDRCGVDGSEPPVKLVLNNQQLIDLREFIDECLRYKESEEKRLENDDSKP